MATAAVLMLYYFTDRQRRGDVSLTNNVWYSCHLETVVDGDSIEAKCHDDGKLLRIRLNHIDAPEMKQGDWGRISKMALADLLTPTIDIRFQGRDVYQRYLGEIKSRQHIVNVELVERGMARVYKRYHPPKIYLTAMQRAKAQKRGIWRETGLHQDPQKFRRLSYK